MLSVGEEFLIGFRLYDNTVRRSENLEVQGVIKLFLIELLKIWARGRGDRIPCTPALVPPATHF